nr:hypothetical protein Iba_chr06cCG4990 [Ipomoea batatas]GMD08773.1 hypothetical protein Iba_chr06dCG1750 [Ipomoea batatas]
MPPTVSSGLGMASCKGQPLKYCGTESPMKNENPRMNFVLKLLRLQNWSKPRPAEAACQTEHNRIMNHETQAVFVSDRSVIRLDYLTHEGEQDAVESSHDWQWYGCNNCPKLSCSFKTKFSRVVCWQNESKKASNKLFIVAEDQINSPSMEKKSIKIADI